MRAFLEAAGHDVQAVHEFEATAEDERVIALALQLGSILITRDKDFGTLSIQQGLAHGPIVRVTEKSTHDQVDAISDLLNKHAADLQGRVLITDGSDRIRVRR